MRFVLLSTAIVTGIFTVMLSCKNAIVKTTGEQKDLIYVCVPCGSSCDTILHKSGGKCEHCQMELVEKSTIVFKNIQPQEICSLMVINGNKKLLLLDVRTPLEFEGKADDKFGKLKNAINIPVQELQARIDELAGYKDDEIIVYCSHSHRSPRASYMLTQNGFKKVTNMLGGMSVWAEAVKDSACNQKIYIRQ
jgi:rhodanese-related sulfurtransferase/DNA-directed RNA polymerase subunit RPC12/RpoP